MKLNNKKVFNSLDAAVIIIFALLFVFLAVKSLSQVSWGTHNITATITAEKVKDDIVPKITEGDNIYTSEGELIGRVTKVYVSPATEVFADTRVDSGNRWPLVTVDVPGHSRIVFTVDIEADSEPRGYSVHGVDIKVNGDVEFNINGFSASGYFSSITEVKANEE